MFFTNVGGIANGGHGISGGHSGRIAGSTNVALALDCRDLRMMNKKLSPTVTACCSVVIGAASAFAIEPQAIEVGIVDLIPEVDTSVAHTDNMFRDEEAPVSSSISLVAPRVTARVTDGLQLFTSTFELLRGDYSATDVDDYTDWRLAALADVEINVRNKLQFEAEYFNTHEVRGTGFSQGGVFTPVPDRFNAKTLAAQYQFGADSARGRIVIDADRYEKEYTNNEATTRFRGRIDNGLSGTFHLGVLPRTDILFQYRVRDVDYVNDPIDGIDTEDRLDSEERYGYVGVTWEATGKTSGTVKLGYGTKDFADPDRTDTSGPSWEAALRWEPRTYSIVEISAGRAFGEPTGIGSGMDTQRYGLDWEHQWSGRIKSTLAISRNDDDYIDLPREDRIRDVSARIDYSVDTWLDVFAAAGRDERRSPLPGFSYEQNVVRIGFAASL